MPKKQFGTWQFDKIDGLVNSVIQKLKSKNSVFSGDRFFEGTGENVLRIFWAKMTSEGY